MLPCIGRLQYRHNQAPPGHLYHHIPGDMRLQHPRAIDFRGMIRHHRFRRSNLSIQDQHLRGRNTSPLHQRMVMHHTNSNTHRVMTTTIPQIQDACQYNRRVDHHSQRRHPRLAGIRSINSLRRTNHCNSHPQCSNTPNSRHLTLRANLHTLNISNNHHSNHNNIKHRHNPSRNRRRHQQTLWTNPWSCLSRLLPTSPHLRYPQIRSAPTSSPSSPPPYTPCASGLGLKMNRRFLASKLSAPPC